MVIADAGFWIALYNHRDSAHQRAIAAAERYQAEGFVTSHAVIAEASHVLRKRAHADVMVGFVLTLAQSDVRVFALEQTDLPRLAELMRKYRDLPMDYADASLVLLAERLRHGRILSTDVRDFGTYRWKNSYPFENLLDAGT